VICPSCSARVKAPEEAAGKTGKCPKCRTALAIPGAIPSTTPDTSQGSSANSPSLPLVPHAGTPVNGPAIRTSKRLHPKSPYFLGSCVAILLCAIAVFLLTRQKHIDPIDAKLIFKQGLEGLSNKWQIVSWTDWDPNTRNSQDGMTWGRYKVKLKYEDPPSGT